MKLSQVDKLVKEKKINLTAIQQEMKALQANIDTLEVQIEMLELKGKSVSQKESSVCKLEAEIEGFWNKAIYHFPAEAEKAGMLDG